MHLTPRMVNASALAGGVVIMIDNLRASATIAAALAAGAASVVPVLTVDEARAQKARMGDALLGGERGGVRPDGFDFGNSPREYTTERVTGRSIVFSTTNGTAALLHARRAGRIVVGAMCNAAAVVKGVMADPRPVHIVCAGTRDEVSLDDCLPAGLMVERLVTGGRGLVADDSGLLCLQAWRGAEAGGVVEAMRASRGGRNLVRLGMEADVEWCSRADVLDVVPEFDVVSGRITIGPSQVR